MASVLSTALLEELRQFVATSLGLRFPEERTGELGQSAVAASKELGYDSPESFVKSILAPPLKHDQIEVLAGHLTVGETYFFREAKTFEALEKHIFPELLSRRRESKSLRIWSAGCATGEEPYSIALALGQMLPDPESWRVTILGTDVNPVFLRKAARGVYREWSFRDVPVWVKRHYFAETKDGRFEILPRIRRMVTFDRHNLAQDPYPSLENNTNAMDLILCRNVLMYLTEEAGARAVSNFHRCLVDDGWLTVSPCELSADRFSGFSAITLAGVTCYRKHRLEQPVAGALPQCSSPPGNGQSMIAPPLSAPPGGPSKIQFPQPLQEQAGIPDPYQEAVSLFDNGSYEQAAETIRSAMASDPPDPRMTRLLARVYANQGRLSEADAWSEKAIASDKLNPGSYYLHALVLEEQGRTAEAVEALKRTLYLDPEFVLAHYTLGNLVQRLGKTAEARKHFRNALSLLRNRKKEDVLDASGGLTAGRLIEIINTTSMETERNE